MSYSAPAPYRMRGFHPVEAARPDLWAPGVVVFDSGPVHVETAPPLLSLKCVFEGEEYYHTDRSLTVGRGELALVGPHVRMEGGIRRGQRARGFAVFLDAKDLPIGVDGDADFTGMMQLAPALARRLEPALVKLCGDMGVCSGAETIRLQPAFHQLRLEVHDYLEEVLDVTERLGLARPTTRDKHAARLLAARADLVRDSEQVISITELGARYGYARAQFTRLFAAAFAESPQSCRDRARLVRARELVRAGKLSLAQIAEKAGYCDYPTFSKAYRRTLGRSPSADRLN